MITHIELENFKGIREKVALDLKPITLLFGANSSGKSTVIHALHYALEVLRNHNLDADRTSFGGESVDLGGFRNFVHGHDIDRHITMLFEFKVDGSLADYAADVDIWADVESRILTAWVRFEVGWSRPLQMLQVFAYEVGANENRTKPIVRIEAGTGKGQAASLVLRVDDPLFGEASDDEGNELAALAADAGIEVTGGYAALPIYQPSALPTWRTPLRLWLDDSTFAAPSLTQIRRVVSKLAVGIGQMLVAELDRLLYVGPLRTVPPRNYRPALTDDMARWAEGLGAWDALHRRGVQFVSAVSRWLQLLGTGYRLDLRQVREVDGRVAVELDSVAKDILAYEVEFGLPESDEESANAPSARRARGGRPRVRGSVPKAELEAKRILRRTYDLFEKRYTALEGREHDDLVLVDERNGVTVRPYDVGVGISQVLPVVVAALYRGQRGARAFVCVEQPELHIHPRLQVALADLFIEQSTSGAVSDHWFLLETHSEHILLRLLRRIRKSSEEQATRTSDGGAGRRGVGIQATGPRRGAAASMAREGGRGASAERGRGAAPPKRRGAGLHAPEDDEDEGSQKPSPVLTPDKVSVIYVQRGADGSTQFIPLRIDERGEFLDVWPEGFFDERLSEVF